MNIIWITTLVIAVIALLVAIGLVFTGKKFAVEVDERVVAIREKLPGNNCGACGYAGCDALAAAISAGDAPVNACPVGGGPGAEEIGNIMGTTAGAVERKTAFVACKGTCDVTKNQGNYIGVQDCRAAVLSGMNVTDCNYGCLGFGSCAEVCPEQAISVQNGVAVVNRSRCVTEPLRQLRPVRESLPAGPDFPDSGKQDCSGSVFQPGQGTGGQENLFRRMYRMRPVREAV